MKNSLLFIALALLTMTGRAQQAATSVADAEIPKETAAIPGGKRHVFTIRQENNLTFNPIGRDWCGTIAFNNDKNKKEEDKPLATERFYLVLNAPYDFTKALITKRDIGAFTAEKVNDTVLAFNKYTGQNVHNMLFTGEYMKNGKVKTLKVRLSRCALKTSPEGKETFYMRGKSHTDEAPEKETGFLAWLGRIF